MHQRKEVQLFIVGGGRSIGFALEERSECRGIAGGRSIGFHLEEWESCVIDHGQRFHIYWYPCCHLLFRKSWVVLSRLVYSLRKEACVVKSWLKFSSVVTSSLNMSEYEMQLRHAKSTIQSKRV